MSKSHVELDEIYKKCEFIIKYDVDKLMDGELSGNNYSLERKALLDFYDDFIKDLNLVIHDGMSNNHHLYINPRIMLKDKVDILVRKIDNIDLARKIYSVLMAACGLILGLIATLPLGIPLCFSPVRSYIGSFFATPRPSSKIVETAMLDVVKDVLSGLKSSHDLDSQVLKRDTQQAKLFELRRIHRGKDELHIEPSQEFNF